MHVENIKIICLCPRIPIFYYISGTHGMNILNTLIKNIKTNTQKANWKADTTFVTFKMFQNTILHTSICIVC